MFSDSLIMAGGSGTRLWPASSSRLPKQFLPADKGMSFFSLALLRALSLSERVIIITGTHHINHVIACACKFSAPEKKRVVIIGEPAAKNTAPAIACALVFSRHFGNDRNMIVLTSDHIIEPLDKFISDAANAETAANDGRLAVFGIKPSRAETGYGYIETQAGGKKNILDAAAFHEKPDAQKAQKFASDKNFFWNSGMFAFKNDFMIEQFDCHAPDVIDPFKKLKPASSRDYTVSKGVKILSGWKGLETAYKKTKNISFDYAIAEKCTQGRADKKTAMIKTHFNWIDIGNWEEYSLLQQRSLLKQTHDCPPVFISSSGGCFVDSDIPVALAGVDDLIVVIRTGKNGEPSAALITKKGQTQKVKEIVEQIKTSDRKDLF